MNTEYKEKFNKMVPEELKLKFKEIQKAVFDLIGAPVPVAAPVVQAPAPVQLQEAKLKDGTAIKYDTPTLAVGSTITIISPEGEKTAPEGEHLLEDGTVIKVGPDGKVTELVPAAAPDMAPQMAQMRQEFESKFTSFADLKKFEALQSEHEATKKELSSVKEQFAKFMEVFGEILETPSADPIEEPKGKFKDEKKTQKEERLKKFLNRK